MYAGYCAHYKRSWSYRSKNLAWRPHGRQKVRHPGAHKVAQGCILCKAGFTQQALTSVWVAFEWCVASLETLVMRCRGVPFTGVQVACELHCNDTIWLEKAD
ncbi:hypothetical protein WJX79_010790 [Trebouxia sp. C0005]